MPFFVAIGIALIKVASLGTASLGAFAAAATVGKIAVFAAASIGLNLAARAFRKDGSGFRPEIARQVVQAGALAQRWAFGEVRSGGYLVYAGSRRGVTARAAYVLSNGACESLDAVVLRGDYIELVSGDDGWLHPKSGTAEDGSELNPYRGKVRFMVNFAADGNQGSELRTVPYNYGDDAEPGTLQFVNTDGTTSSEPGLATVAVRYQKRRYPRDSEFFNSQTAGTIEIVEEPYATDFPAWTEDHRLNGVSWVSVEFTQPDYEDFKDRFWQYWPFHQIEFVFKGMKLTWPGQDTPTWTRNVAAIYHWWLTARRGVPADRIDRAAFDAAYALCEEDVTYELPDTHSDYNATVKRYAADGIVSSGESVQEIEDGLNTAWAGEYIEDGRIYFRPGEDRTSSLTLDDSYLIEDAIPSWQPWRPLDQRFNAVDCRLGQSREHKFEDLVLPRFIDTDSREKDGELRAHVLDLPYTNDPITGARNARILLSEQREQRLVVIPVVPGPNYEVMALRPRDVVTWGSETWGLAPALYRVETMVFDISGVITLVLRQDDPETYIDSLILPPLKQENVARLSDEGSVPIDDVVGLSLREIVDVAADGTVEVYLEAAWTSVAPATQVQWQLVVFEMNDDGEVVLDGDGDPVRDYEESIWSESIRVEGHTATNDIPGVVGNVWRARVRHVHGERSASRWVFAEVTIDGKTDGPPPPTDIEVLAAPSSVDVSWTNPEDADFSHVEIEAVAETQPALPADPIPMVSRDAFGRFARVVGLVSETSYVVRLRSFDTSGNFGDWSDPSTQDSGPDIEGAAGTDGFGRELVFARTPQRDASDNPFVIAMNERPLNTWTFDQTNAAPITRGRVTWHDGVPVDDPEVSEYIWQSERSITGAPKVGDEVVDGWSVPVIITADGVDGRGGEDGNGVEFVYAVTPDDTTLDASQRPGNDWAYDSPAAIGGLQWHDGAPTLTKALGILWVSSRRVPGQPAVGDPRPAADDPDAWSDWSIPTILTRIGDDGEDAIGHVLTRTHRIGGGDLTDGGEDTSPEFDIRYNADPSEALFCIVGVEDTPYLQRVIIGSVISFNDGDKVRRYRTKTMASLQDRGCYEFQVDVLNGEDGLADKDEVVLRFTYADAGLPQSPVGYTVMRIAEEMSATGSPTEFDVNLFNMESDILTLGALSQDDISYLDSVPVGTRIWIDGDHYVWIGETTGPPVKTIFATGPGMAYKFTVKEIQSPPDITNGETYPIHFSHVLSAGPDVVRGVEEGGLGSIRKIWRGTQDQYDALDEYDEQTIYFIAVA